MPTNLISKITNFLQIILSGKDNKTFDIGRILWTLGVLGFLAIGIYVYFFLHQEFHPIEFGTGLGVALAGGGTGVAVKSKTEPEN